MCLLQPCVVVLAIDPEPTNNRLQVLGLLSCRRVDDDGAVAVFPDEGREDARQDSFFFDVLVLPVEHRVEYVLPVERLDVDGRVTQLQLCYDVGR